MVFIAYNYEGLPVSVVCARSKELAYAYWQGKGILPHSHKSLDEDFTDIDEHITGVFEFIKTTEVSDYDLSNTCRNPKNRKFLMIVKD